MVRIINKDELAHEPQLIEDLRKSVFIYPTDTIYGIGCDATNKELVARIREIKKSPEQPFSIIIPNKNTVYDCCATDERTKQWLDKLPGPYTLIFKIKTKNKLIADNVNPGKDTIGIRIPNHWFYKFVKKMKVPIITTSANVTGEDFMTNLEDLDSEIRRKVDFIINDGTIKGRPSTLIRLDTKEIEVKER